MVDVNTIVGTPIQTPDGVTLIPISKLTFGFTAGGSEFTTKHQQQGTPNAFGGGSGAGVNITPVAFLIVRGDNARILNVTPPPATSADRIIEAVPNIIETLTGLFKKKEEQNSDD
jgi:sporulation protein YtfJ